MTTTTHSLSVALIAPSWGEAQDWIRVEQVVVPDDVATPAEAARLVDAVFSLSTCDQGEGTGTGTVQVAADGSIIPPVEQEEFLEIVDATTPLTPCLAAGDFSWTAEVDIVRSRNDLPYVIRITGGTLQATTAMGGQIAGSLFFEEATAVQLRYPVTGGTVSGTWGNLSAQGTPVWTVRDGSVVLDRPATGQLNLTYTTAWERVTVTVPGKEGELQSAELLCFWNRMAEQITLDPPAIDASAAGDADLCAEHRVAGSSNDDPTPPECYEIVNKIVRCQCSGDEVSRTDVEMNIPCPEGTTPGKHLLRSRDTVSAYIDCGESASGHIGGASYMVNDPAFYLEQCCERHQHALPLCPEMKAVWQPTAGVQPSIGYWQEQYGQDLRFVGVVPRQGNCGELVKKWEINPIICSICVKYFTGSTWLDDWAIWDHPLLWDRRAKILFSGYTYGAQRESYYANVPQGEFFVSMGGTQNIRRYIVSGRSVTYYTINDLEIIALELGYGLCD
jgi:hypothetical protein